MAEYVQILETVRYPGNKEKFLDLLATLKNPRPSEIIDTAFHNNTLLHWAARNGWTDVCQLLIEEYKVSTHSRTSGGRTALHFAASEDNSALCRLLVERYNMDPHIKSESGITTLHTAIYGGDGWTDTCELLVEKYKVDPHCRDVNGWTALHYVAASVADDKLSVQASRVLVEKYKVNPYCKTIDGLTILHFACLLNKTNLIEYLITSVCCDPLAINNAGITPLDLVIGCEQKQYIQKIIDNSNMNGFVQVSDYLKHSKAESTFIKAMTEGKGKLYLCNIVFHGPPGAGKSSVKRLMLGHLPYSKQKQNSSNIIENCVRTVSIGRVDTSENHCFKEVDKEDFISRIAAEVEKYHQNEIERQHEIQTSTAEARKELLHGSVTGDDDKCTAATEYVCDSLSSEDQTCDDELQSSHSFIEDLVKKKLLYPVSYSKPVFDTHWLHHIDSGGQPQFLEVFPLVYRSPYSHFLVIVRLTETLDDRPKVRFYDKGRDTYCLPDHLLSTNRETVIQICQIAQRIGRTTKGKFTPRVFVIGTHMDKLGLLGRSKCLKQFNEQLVPVHKMYSDVMVCKSPDEIIFPLNAMANGKERQKFTEELQQHVLSAMECVKEPFQVPLKWLMLHLELDKKSNGVIRMSECIELGNKLGMNQETVQAALEFLNSAAMVLYYPNDVPDLVLTKMDPFISRLSMLIKASFHPPDKGPAKESIELRERGVFEKPFLKRVFSNNVEDESISEEEFLKLLVSLRIAASVGEDKYFLPSALTLQPSQNPSLFHDNSNPLALYWDGFIIPYGFFLTMSVELQVKSEKDEYQLELRKDIPQFRGEIQLSEIKGKIPGVIKLSDQHQWIEVAYIGDESYCPKVCSLINNATKRTIQCFKHTGIEFPTIGCVCVLCTNKPRHYSKISDDRRFITCSTDNSKTGPVTSKINCWFEDNHKADRGATSIIAQDPQTCNLNLSSILSSPIIEVTDWTSLGLALGLPYYELERIRRDGYDEKDRLQRMLSLWLDSGNGSWEGLAQALIHPLVDEHHLAEKIQVQYININSNA